MISSKEASTLDRTVEGADVDAWIASIAHDLRNPLAAVSLTVEALRRQSDDREIRDDGLRRIECCVQRMNVLIADLLDLARLDIRAAPALDHRCAPAAVIHAVIDLFRPLATAKRIVLDGRASPSLPTVRADPARILRVLANLVSNAIDFTPSGGCIHIDASSSAQRVRFVVSDSGEGIPKQLQPYVFERFWQARRGARSGQGSVGLGLYIAKAIVEAHRGQLWIESEAGSGCRICFDLPADEALERSMLAAWRPDRLG